MSELGHMGWGFEHLSIQKNLYNERILYDVMCDNMPEKISFAYDREETPIEKKIRKLFQFDEGWSFHIVEQIIYDRVLLMSQNLGNCVGASHAQLIASKVAHDIYVSGQNELMFGENTDPQIDSVVPYITFSYQAGKMLAGSRPSSDGSWGNVQQKASLTIGILPCSTPGLVGPFPQPSASVTRSFGPSMVKKYQEQASKHLMLDSRQVKSFEELKQAIVVEKTPCQITSGWGFASAGFDTKYGITIFKASGSWAHSMQLIAVFELKGQWFVLVRNQWGDKHGEIGLGLPRGCFVITSETADRWLKDAFCFTIGDIQMNKIKPSFQI